MSIHFDDDIWSQVEPHNWKWRQRARGRTPRLILLHATRSVIEGRSALQEYQSTKNWFTSSNNTMSGDTETYAGMASYIVGGGRVCRVMPEDIYPTYSLGHGDPIGLSIEIGQNLDGVAFEEGDLENAARLCAYLCEKYDIPARLLPWLSRDNHEQPGIARHDRSENGRRLGKTDPGGAFDDGAFAQRVERIIRGETEEDNVLRLIKSSSSDMTWATDGMSRWLVPNPAVLRNLREKKILPEEVPTVSPEALNAIPLLARQQRT